MELNEIKKLLYKNKPTAKLFCANMYGLTYSCYADAETYVNFKIPLNELSETNFYSEMDAKLLIRWIQ